MPTLYRALSNIVFKIGLPFFKLSDWLSVKADGIDWARMTPEEHADLDAKMQELSDAFVKSLEKDYPKAPHLPS